MKRPQHLPYLAAAALAFPALAFASLGGTAASVQSDSAHMKATIHVANTAQKYTVQEMETPTGTKVREYVSAGGTVFGVAWDGPVMPDFRQVLGTYFDTFTQAPKAAQTGHSHLLIQQPDLVVRSSGHMRAFKGSAFVPGLLPEGVNANDIL